MTDSKERIGKLHSHDSDANTSDVQAFLQTAIFRIMRFAAAPLTFLKTQTAEPYIRPILHFLKIYQ